MLLRVAKSGFVPAGAIAKVWWALGDDLRTFEAQSGQPCLTSGVMGQAHRREAL